jgi:microcystin-dependent protein
MSNQSLTNAGRAFLAAKQGAGQPAIFDRFMLANIPSLDHSQPVNQDEPTPAVGDQIKTVTVNQSGYISPDEVVYSLYLPTTDGDYTYNWLGLLADDDTLVAVTYLAPVNKYATAGGNIGNALNENIMVAYTDAQAITNITVDANTWQWNWEHASESQKGLIEIADEAETLELAALDLAVPPKHLGKALEEFYSPNNPPPPGVLTGSVIPFAGSLTPAGYLRMNGAAVSRTTYADLFATIGTTYGAGDGTTTFNLPEARAEFMRFWDDGRGVDSGRFLGSAQLDQMQKITGTIEAVSYNGRGLLRNGSGALQTAGSTVGAMSITSQSSSRHSDLSFDSSSSPNARVSSTTDGETRSRNIAFLGIIKY